MNHLMQVNGRTKNRAEPSVVGWDEDAACKGQSAMFFKDLPTYDPRQAKRLCRHCPCLAACLEDALDHESGDPRNHAGVRAGYEAHELVELRRKSRPHYQENRA